ncbi:hypothetical protein IAQ61_007744, partial [Plenodomus lingam]|uniref:uncharacterized protein n=1 Tax=Leptosphaeria maculans TaxID=5022 RepID=UPI00331A3E98
QTARDQLLVRTLLAEAELGPKVRHLYQNPDLRQAKPTIPPKTSKTVPRTDLQAVDKIMTRSEDRERQLECKLADMTAAYNQEKASHEAEKSIVYKSRLQHRKAERSLHFMMLAAKMNHADAEVAALEEGDKFHTDHNILRTQLPSAPVDPPKRHNVSSVPTSRSNKETKDNKKRSLDVSDEPAEPSANDVFSRIVVCLNCYKHRLICDHGEPYLNCKAAGLACARAKCKDFEPGACQRQACLRAHSEDLKSYDNIVNAGHVSKVTAGEPLMKKLKKMLKKDNKRDNDDNGDRDDKKG